VSDCVYVCLSVCLSARALKVENGLRYNAKVGTDIVHFGCEAGVGLRVDCLGVTN